jgi:hypothetical protein
MIEYYFKGGDWKDPTNFEPNGTPSKENGDMVIFNQCTDDVIVDINSNCAKLKMTDFKKDIYYGIVGGSIRTCGILRNDERYDLFINRPDIERVD